MQVTRRSGRTQGAPLQGLGKDVLTVGVERQGSGPDHGAHRYAAVEMREEVAAACRLPFKVRTECIGIAGDEYKTGLSGTVLGCTFAHLSCSRKVNETVHLIFVRALIGPGALGRRPFSLSGHVKYQFHGATLEYVCRT